MKLTNYIIGMLIMSACFLSVYGMLEHLAKPENYNIDVDTSYQSTYNKVTAISEDFNKTRTALQKIPADKDTPFYQYPVDLFINAKNVIFGTIGGITGSLGLGFNVISDFARDLGLPAWGESLLYAILLVMIVGILYYVFVGRKL